MKTDRLLSVLKMSVVAQIGSLPTALVDALIFFIGLFSGILADRVLPYLFRRKLLKPKLRVVDIEAHNRDEHFCYKVDVTNSAGLIGRLVSRETAKNCTPKIDLDGRGTLDYLNGSPEGKIDFYREVCWANGKEDEDIPVGDKVSFHLLRWDGDQNGEVLFPTTDGYDEDEDQEMLYISGEGEVRERNIRAIKSMEEWNIREIRIAPNNSVAKGVELDEFPWDNNGRTIEWGRRTIWSRLRDAVPL